MHENAPYKHDKEELNPEQGTEYAVHVFVGEDGQEFIRKRFLDRPFKRSMFRNDMPEDPEPETTEELNEELEGIAKLKNKVYKILKESLGDSMADTMYVVSEGEDKKNVLDQIQKKVKGLRADEAVEAGLIDFGDLKAEKLRIKNEVDELWEKHPELSKIPNAWRVRTDTVIEENLIVTPEGKVIIIDW